MRNFMKNNYARYYVELPNGETVETTREECFAPSDNPNQRWYWDNEQHTIAVRLAPTARGKAIGNFHESSLRSEERYYKWRNGCRWKGKPQCRQRCSMCGYCDWDSPDDCLRCEQKCMECFLEDRSRVVDLDRYWNDANGREYELSSDTDVEIDYEKREMLEALSSALAELTEDERTLWDYLVEGVPKQEIAARLGVSRVTLNKMESDLFDIIRDNAELKKIFLN